MSTGPLRLPTASLINTDCLGAVVLYRCMHLSPHVLHGAHDLSVYNRLHFPRTVCIVHIHADSAAFWVCLQVGRHACDPVSANVLISESKLTNFIFCSPGVTAYLGAAGSIESAEDLVAAASAPPFLLTPLQAHV